MSDAALRTMERDTSAAGRRRLVLERARRAPQGNEAMEALRLLAFMGDEEASAATGQARSAMLWGDEAWGGLSVTAAATVRVIQDGWPEAWRLGWRLHLAVARAILPDWCDGPHPESGVISVAEARLHSNASARSFAVESHREGMRASRRCAGVCGETRRRLHILEEWLGQPRGSPAGARLAWATSGDDPHPLDDDEWRSVYAIFPPGPVLAVPSPDRSSLWPTFGRLLAEGDRVVRDRVALAGGQVLAIWLVPWRRRWTLAGRKVLREFAQFKLVEAVGLEWPGRMA